MRLFVALPIAMLLVLTLTQGCRKNSPPDAPVAPAGPSAVAVGDSASIVTWTTDPDGDDVSYQLDWGDGTHSDWSAPAPSGNTVTMTKVWSDPGTFHVRSRAKDQKEATSDWSTELTVTATLAHSPSVPRVTGAHGCGVGTRLSLAVSSTDADGDSVSFEINWTDTTTPAWTSFVASGDTLQVTHIYLDSGNYSVRARARDPSGRESDWSAGHEVAVTARAPSTPMLAGPDSAYAGASLKFLVSATDPEGDSISYQVDWADTTTPVWSDLAASGETVEMTHVFRDTGSFTIRARAKDPGGRESDWSAGHQIALDTLPSGYPDTVLAKIQLGGDPVGIDATPDGEYVYVALKGSNQVSVIRVADNTEVRRVSVGGGPHAVCITPNGHYAYVPNSGSNDVSVIRLADDSVIAQVPVGSYPIQALALPDGQAVLVPNYNSDDISVISTQTNSVIATVDLPVRVWGIGALPDGSRVYAANRLATLYVIDVPEYVIADSVAVHPGPEGLASLHSGEFVYVTGGLSEVVDVVRTLDNVLVKSIPVGGCPVDVVPLPGDAYVVVASYSSGEVRVIRVQDSSLMWRVSGVDGACYMASLPSGQAVYVCASGVGEVWVLGRKGATGPK